MKYLVQNHKIIYRNAASVAESYLLATYGIDKQSLKATLGLISSALTVFKYTITK